MANPFNAAQKATTEYVTRSNNPENPRDLANIYERPSDAAERLRFHAVVKQ